MILTYVQLGENSEYSRFSKFDCSYEGLPDYVREDIDSLSRYLSDADNGARSDLAGGLGVTTVAYKDGDLAGYFTLMSGSIIEGRIGEEFRDRFPFYCITYPALKISRFAVDRHFQSKKDELGLKISDYMLAEIFSIGTSLANVGPEAAYSDSLQEKRMEHVGLRFVIADALGTRNTIKFYSSRGFRPFKTREKIADGNVGMFRRFLPFARGKAKSEISYETMWREILAGTNRKPDHVEHVGIPMYFDLLSPTSSSPAAGQKPVAPIIRS